MHPRSGRLSSSNPEIYLDRTFASVIENLPRWGDIPQGGSAVDAPSTSRNAGRNNNFRGGMSYPTLNREYSYQHGFSSQVFGDEIPPPHLRYSTRFTTLPTPVATERNPRVRCESLPTPFICPSAHDNARQIIILELTLKKRMAPEQVDKHYAAYMKRDMRIIPVTSVIKLLVFCHPPDAAEVLRGPCEIGAIVPLKDACVKSQEQAKIYKMVLTRRRNYFTKLHQK